MANPRVTTVSVTAIAAVNGLLVEVGLGVLDGVVPRWIGTSPVLDVEISIGLTVLIVVGTVLNIVVGLGATWGRARWIGLASYVGAFLGGQLFLYHPTVGSAGILVSAGLAAVAPMRTWTM